MHSQSSRYLGVDEFGHDCFETIRTEVGQLVYDLKYGNNQSVVPKIIEIITTQIKDFKIFGIIDMIIPVPPSRHRENQPVEIIANALGVRMGIPVIKNEVIKIKETPELKGMADPSEREEILRNAFGLAGKNDLSNKNVLLIDDLYRSGATLRAITSILYEQGSVESIYVIVLTKTRSNR